MRVALVILIASGCAYIMPEKKQDPFPTVEVKATRPAPGPDRIVLTASSFFEAKGLAAGNTSRFQEITLRRDEPNDPVLRFCVVAKLQLSKPPGDRVVVDSYPIEFEWAHK